MRNHDDYIDPKNFPEFWLNLDITVEVEAKAKKMKEPLAPRCDKTTDSPIWSHLDD